MVCRSLLSLTFALASVAAPVHAEERTTEEAAAAEEEPAFELPSSISVRPTKAKGPAQETRTVTNKGQLISETTYAYGVKHGRYRSYFSNGQIIEEGDYEDGLRAGPWKRYDKAGNVLFEWQYTAGLKTGIQTQYGDGSGRMKGQRVAVRRTPYSFGLEQGVSKETRNNGNPYAEGAFVAGRKEGVWTYYDLDGQKARSVSYTCGRKVGTEVPGGSRACPPVSLRIPLPTLVMRDGESKADFGQRVTRWRVKFRLIGVACARANIQWLVIAGKRIGCSEPFRLRTNSGAAGGGTRG